MPCSLALTRTSEWPQRVTVVGNPAGPTSLWPLRCTFYLLNILISTNSQSHSNTGLDDPGGRFKDINRINWNFLGI